MLEKKYDSNKVEKNKYETWLKNDCFKAGDLTKEPFSIVIPPPNVTGKLHLGHAWDVTLQDIIIRYKKMSGYDVLWLPGMDHAGIATQAKVDRRLKDMGENPRKMNRDKWLTHAWSWKEEYANTIHKQWSKMGLSLDYSRERFTLDDGINKAVNKVFVDLYNEGLIYKGKKIINWDPEAMTALSNEEVIYKDVEGAFYYLKYFIEETNNYLEIATTRPETLFGDTAVAVNPKDDRYKDLIGKNVILPIVGRLIPIVGDYHADMEFGTGVVKITPAHDPNDFEVGNRHNLERINVLNPNGTMNENAGKYEGLDRFKCREEVIEELEKTGILIKTEKIIHSVGHSERTNVMVEPYLSKQWFVKMRPLADRVLENQKSNDNKVNFVPERFEKIMNHWMEITYDWCISRQLWWGHQIPAWYKEDEVYVGLEAPKEEGWTRDEDVLDTWFSSALWPFSTLGWPEETKDLQRYYPNNVLVTGYDIIPFWVNRMTFQGLHFTNQRPFKDCLIHGLIRDKDGIKMSKSLGNGIDPMEVIDKYGADSLRYFLTTNSAAGQDLRYDDDKVKATWNFINKIWNASRFVLMNTEDLVNINLSNLTSSDKWILDKLNKVIINITKNMEKYEFNLVGNELYKFIWDDFCDSYIEFAKTSVNNVSTKSCLIIVLTSIIKMLHPFMPYVTEEIYNFMPIKDAKMIMISSYPKYNKNYVFEKEAKEIETLIEIISTLRNVILEKNVPKGFKIINNFDNNNKHIIENNSQILTKLLKCDIIISSVENSETLDVVFTGGKLTICYETKGTTSEDIMLLSKSKDELEASIRRRKSLLTNEKYVTSAPQKIVEAEREKLNDEELKLKEVIKKIG
ncbi:MAG: valine--tRNA ligase [Bacilli bacterium]